MSASTRASVLLLHRCSTRACDKFSKPLVPISRLAAGRRWAVRPLPPVGGSLTHARCSSFFGSSRGGESETESPAASETSDGSEGASTSASSLASKGAAGSAAPSFAFAFDIDGVLLHSAKALPGAADTLRYLQRNKIPFILLTNGGGKSEAERVADLSSKLGVDLDTSNFVQSHTPYQWLARFSADNWNVSPSEPKQQTPFDPEPGEEFKKAVIRSGVPWYLQHKVGVTNIHESTVLVIGSDASKARHIAQGYGFKSVVTPGDILKACPEIFPFNPLHEFYDKQEIMPLPKPIYDPAAPENKLEDCLKIDLILVFNDPRDWAVDIQLISDLMFSHRGYLGTYSRKNGERDAFSTKRLHEDGQPALVFSNRDFLWSTGYHLSRFGQGAFIEAVRANFRMMAARILQLSHDDRRVPDMKSFSFGKPMQSTYLYAQQLLLEHHNELWQQQQQQQQQQQPSPAPRIETVYMVGDNPESDIRGANGMAKAVEESSSPEQDTLPGWAGCLVKTGVWSEDTLPLKNLRPDWRPEVVHDDVKATVNWALEKHGWPGRVE